MFYLFKTYIKYLLNFFRLFWTIGRHQLIHELLNRWPLVAWILIVVLRICVLVWHIWIVAEVVIVRHWCIVIHVFVMLNHVIVYFHLIVVICTVLWLCSSQWFIVVVMSISWLRLIMSLCILSHSSIWLLRLHILPVLSIWCLCCWHCNGLIRLVIVISVNGIIRTLLPVERMMHLIWRLIGYLLVHVARWVNICPLIILIISARIINIAIVLVHLIWMRDSGWFYLYILVAVAVLAHSV